MHTAEATVDVSPDLLFDLFIANTNNIGKGCLFLNDN
jgi:hypothetical protein